MDSTLSLNSFFDKHGIECIFVEKNLENTHKVIYYFSNNLIFFTLKEFLFFFIHYTKCYKIGDIKVFCFRILQGLQIYTVFFKREIEYLLYNFNTRSMKDDAQQSNRIMMFFFLNC